MRGGSRLAASLLCAGALLAGCAIVPGGQAGPKAPSDVPASQAPAATAPGSAVAPAPILRATPTPPIAAAARADATTGREAGIVAGPDIGTLGLSRDGAARALEAFRRSCPAIMRRTDLSGLTESGDWKQPCDAAARWDAGEAERFFATEFSLVQLGDGKAFVTGYYDPQIPGSLSRTDVFNAPIYGVPPDLVEIDLGKFSKALAGRKIRGRFERGTLVPYADRTAIENGALTGKAPVLGYADPVDLFVMQIQGSGTLKLPDGTVVRLAYANQNGHDYTGIGRVLRDRGELEPGKATMPDIVRYLKADRARGTQVMRENASYVFFRKSSGPPVGALNIPVFRQASVAADPLFVPMGAPVWLSLDRAEPNGLWIVQDTGGAIKGPNRFDSFWGAGNEAERIAGGMAARGSALIFLPKASAARLMGQ